MIANEREKTRAGQSLARGFARDLERVAKLTNSNVHMSANISGRTDRIEDLERLLQMAQSSECIGARWLGC